MGAGRSLIIVFTATAGFAVTVRQSLVMADPPVAYYQLGEAPGCTIAVDSSANAHDGVFKGISTWRVLKWNAPFTIEAWVQVMDDYQVNSKIPGGAETGTGSAYVLDTSRSEASLSGSTNDLAEARGVLDRVATHNHALTLAPVEAEYGVETVFETSALTLLLGLTLILFGLRARGWRGPLKFRGCGSEVLRAGIFQVEEMKLRRRSEAELNSFSACYATVRVKAPLAGGGLARH
jgi:hypothetical protein